jgi:hypothetical protein
MSDSRRWRWASVLVETVSVALRFFRLSIKLHCYRIDIYYPAVRFGCGDGFPIL